MTWTAEITVNGAIYSYPAGPTLANYSVIRVPNGDFLIHYGNAMMDPHKPADVAQVVHLGPHHIKINDNGATILDDDLAVHFWNGCYDVRPHGFKIKKTPKQVYDAKLAPVFGNTGYPRSPATSSPFVPPWDASLKTKLLWSTSNVTQYMPTTGERGDIGLFPDVAADYLLRSDPTGMLAWARSAGGFCYHWHDETGLPVSVLKYAGINAYDQEDKQGDPVPGTLSPYIIKGPREASGYWMWGNSTVPQPAHFCDMTYLATVVCEDPIFLLYTQEAAVFCIGNSAEQFTKSGARVMAGEYRGIGHGLGMIFKARAATKDAIDNGYFIPTMHRDLAYWDAIIANQVEFYGETIKAGAAARFGIIVDWDTYGPWQHEYLLMACCFAILSGVTSWVPIFLNCLKGTVLRYQGGARSWPPAWGGYYVYTRDYSGALLADGEAMFDHFYQRNVDGKNNGDIAIVKVDYDRVKADPMNGGKPTGSNFQAQTSHAVFAFAAYLEDLGLVDVHKNFPTFDVARANNEILYRNLGYADLRYQVVQKYDPTNAPPAPPPVYIPPVPPPVDPTPPPVVPPIVPPPGDIHMSDTTFTLTPGQTKQLDFLDDAGHKAVLAESVTVDQTMPDVFSLQLNTDGVLVTYHNPGTSKITVHATGANGPLSASSVGTAARPLSSSLNLVPRAG